MGQNRQMGKIGRDGQNGHSPDDLVVTVADGSPLFRIGLVAVLTEAGMTVADEGADVERAIAAINRAAPAVAVIDLDLPHPGGIAVLEALQNAAVPTRVLILAAGPDSAPLYRALSLGVGGYLAKRSEADRVCAAIAAVAGGETVIDEPLPGGARGRDPAP